VTAPMYMQGNRNMENPNMKHTWLHSKIAQQSRKLYLWSHNPKRRMTYPLESISMPGNTDTP